MTFCDGFAFWFVYLQFLTSRGVDIESRTNTGYTTLMIAACNGHVKIVQVGSFINICTILHQTKGKFCSIWKDITAMFVWLWTWMGCVICVVQYLIDRGADVDAMDFWFETAVLNAARNNDFSLVAAMISSGEVVLQKHIAFRNPCSFWQHSVPNQPGLFSNVTYCLFFSTLNHCCFVSNWLWFLLVLQKCRFLKGLIFFRLLLC